MKNQLETDRKDLIIKRKGEARYLRGHKKNCKQEFAWTTKKWKECTATEVKIGQI